MLETSFTVSLILIIYFYNYNVIIFAGHVEFEPNINFALSLHQPSNINEDYCPSGMQVFIKV